MIVGVVWGGVVVVALVILTFCGYELHWKSARLARDAARLRQAGASSAVLAEQLQAARTRAGSIRR